MHLHQDKREAAPRHAHSRLLDTQAHKAFRVTQQAPIPPPSKKYRRSLISISFCCPLILEQCRRLRCPNEINDRQPSPAAPWSAGCLSNHGSPPVTGFHKGCWCECRRNRRLFFSLCRRAILYINRPYRLLFPACLSPSFSA